MFFNEILGIPDHIFLSVIFSSIELVKGSISSGQLFFKPPPFEEWWRGIKCYPCPCVRSSVRPSVIKIWCPLNNLWKTASIQIKFSMLKYIIKTQIKFHLGYNPLISDGVMGLL